MKNKYTKKVSSLITTGVFYQCENKIYFLDTNDDPMKEDWIEVTDSDKIEELKNTAGWKDITDIRRESLNNFVRITTLNSMGKEYNGIHYILKEDAEQMVKEFGKNEYDISDNGKGFYRITKDRNGRVGDFLLSIPTESDLKELEELMQEESPAIQSTLAQTDNTQDESTVINNKQIKV